MRQHLGEKKIKKYRQLTGLPIIRALVRGGTDHRIDFLLEGGKVLGYFPRTGETEEHLIGWDWEKWKEEHRTEREKTIEGGKDGTGIKHSTACVESDKSRA